MIETQLMYPVRKRLLCSKCFFSDGPDEEKEVEMECVSSQPTNPMKYFHVCPKCGHTLTTARRYPFINHMPDEKVRRHLEVTD